MFVIKDHQRLFANLSLFSLLVLITIAVTSYYVFNEHTFYFWDYAQYQDMTAAKAIYFCELSPNSFIKALKEIWNSTAQDYSDFHTLLSIPFILIFGNNRFVYILSLALLYLLPFSLALGAIATKLIPPYPRSVFWSTAFLTLLTPAAWLPTLWGYPDTGSALLIALAILIYLQNTNLKHFWQIAGIGFCLALAILFRRHFIYATISFLGCITLQSLILFYSKVKRRRKKALGSLLKKIRQIAWTVTALLFFLILLGWPFVDRVLNTNFGILYSSYEQPVSVSIEYYRGYYGWIACILAALGITAGIFNRVLARPIATFIALLASFSLLQWVLKVKQLGFHYSLHFTPWIILGLAAFYWTVWSTLKEKNRTLTLTAIAVYFGCNMVIGLAPLDKLPKNPISQIISSTSLPKLFINNYSPQNRTDYNEIIQLVNYLRSESSADDPIYVAASSGVISDDLLWHADRTLHENVMSYSSKEFWRSKGLNILHWSPFADSRDPYPLERLFYSNYVVIPTPFQYHLRPEEHDVLRVVVDAFTQNWEFAQDFTRLPKQFSLERGVGVSIYKRVRPTSLETAVRTLKAMQNYVGDRPGGQLSWLSLSAVPGYYVEKNRNNTYNIDFYSDKNPQPSTTSLFYLDTPVDQATITGQLKNLDSRCSDLAVNLAVMDGQGKVINTTKLVNASRDTANLSLSLPVQDSAYLVLNISGNDPTNNSTNHCGWSLRNLAVSAQ